MRQILFQLTTLLFIFHLAACHRTNSLESLDQNTPDLAADSLAIHATLENWYNAMYKVDSTGILELLTPQFLLLEDTLPLSGTELVARLKKGGGQMSIGLLNSVNFVHDLEEKWLGLHLRITKHYSKTTEKNVRLTFLKPLSSCDMVNVG